MATLHPRALRYTFAVGDFVDLVDSIPDEDLPRTDEAGVWLSEIVQQVARRRGMVAPREAEEVDIVDPFRRDGSAYRRMSEQLDILGPGLARALGAS